MQGFGGGHMVTEWHSWESNPSCQKLMPSKELAQGFSTYKHRASKKPSERPV